MTGAQLIEDERRRQIERGYTAEHDQQRRDPVLLTAATSILSHSKRPDPIGVEEQLFQAKEIYDSAKRAATYAGTFGEDSEEVRRLQIAGALIAAEIDRILYRRRMANGPRKLSEITKGG